MQTVLKGNHNELMCLISSQKKSWYANFRSIPTKFILARKCIFIYK